jgi:hypothetical protein
MVGLLPGADMNRFFGSLMQHDRVQYDQNWATSAMHTVKFDVKSTSLDEDLLNNDKAKQRHQNAVQGDKVPAAELIIVIVSTSLL